MKFVFLSSSVGNRSVELFWWLVSLKTKPKKVSWPFFGKETEGLRGGLLVQKRRFLGVLRFLKGFPFPTIWPKTTYFYGFSRVVLGFYKGFSGFPTIWSKTTYFYGFSYVFLGFCRVFLQGFLQ